MEIDLGPLSELTPLGVFSLSILITVIDVVAAYILAATQNKFDLGYVGAWLMTHSVKRLVPIYTLLAFGVGVSFAEIPAIPAAFGLAVAGVIAYAGETIKSVLVNFNDARAVHDETSVPAAGPVDLT